jgi:hypothetical protein
LEDLGRILSAGRRQRCEAAKEVRAFRVDHEESRLERLAGRPAVFPHGTYAMRVVHGVEVAEPRPDAIVAQPGPLLSEVLEALRGEESSDARVQVLDEVRAAWVEEASEVVAADELDFAGAAPATTEAQSATDFAGAAPATTEAQSATEPRARREPEVRHRFHRERDEGREHARRLIIERDRRSSKKPGGSDPPV